MIGKIIGFLLGLTIGPYAALLGLAVGHFFDRGLARAFNPYAGQTAEAQQTFFSTAFLLIGHLAKADGHVSAQEINRTELFMRQMGLTAEHREQAIELFNQGRNAGFSSQSVLQEFNRVCRRFGNLRQMLLVYLIGVALADGELHPEEDRVLRQIGLSIGFNSATYETLLAMSSAQSQFAGFGGRTQDRGRATGYQPRPDEVALAYQALGIAPQSSDKQVTRAYRKLISEYHPDKLIGQGMPEDMIQMATERSQEVQIAYDLIKKSRKM